MARNPGRSRRRERQSSSCHHVFRQSVDQRLEIRRLVYGRHENEAILRNYDEVLDSVEYDADSFGVHHVAMRLHRMSPSRHRVVRSISRANAMEGAPGADVIPIEVTRHDHDTIASLEDA